LPRTHAASAAQMHRNRRSGDAHKHRPARATRHTTHRSDDGEYAVDTIALAAPLTLHRVLAKVMRQRNGLHRRNIPVASKALRSSKATTRAMRRCNHRARSPMTCARSRRCSTRRRHLPASKASMRGRNGWRDGWRAVSAPSAAIPPAGRADAA
jgi:hypothetical protein